MRPLRLETLDFYGRNDSLFHEFDRAGNRHMEYLRDRGAFADVPFDEIVASFREAYGPAWFSGPGGDFHAEAEPDAPADEARRG